MSCSFAEKDKPIDQWLEMEFIVDGRVDIQFIVPPARASADMFEPQFISTSVEPVQTMLFASYDPGSGRDRDILLTSITSTIVRIEQKLNQESAPSLDYIKNEIYLSRADAKKKFEIFGEVEFDNQSWLRVNIIGGYRRGISYATIIGGEYIHILSMSIYGEKSDQKKLFQIRHETLKKMVNSTKMTIE